ncbi:hypothetical protein D3C71_1735170 [compost metagenome]
MGADRPLASAGARSSALSACRAAVFSRSSRASASRARLLVAAEARAIFAEAALAWAPRVCVYSTILSAFMPRF